LSSRLEEHQTGCGANYTKTRLPVRLIYFEEFDRIDKAFYKEKQIQGWSHKKKKALIEGNLDKLVALAKTSSRQAR